MAATEKIHPQENVQVREYRRHNAVVFLKTREQFGGLSNMASGFPLRVNGVAIRSSEALYQACRFPHRPELQAKIIEQASPMTAKMVGKPYRDDSRSDWDRVRTKIMRWCLRVKLAQNFRAFSELLLSTGDRPIVEQSSKDDFWGAKPFDDDGLIGCNILGRLLMEMRELVRACDPTQLQTVEPLALPEFLLLGRPIETIGTRSGDIQVSQKSAPATSIAGSLSTPKDIMPTLAAASIRKKLIEVSIPLEAINIASAREKSIRHGHPSTLHLWWARRPLAACRAILFAQLVDDPSSWPDRFPTYEAQDAERRRLHKVIEALVPWEATNDEAILNLARWEIARSVAWGLGDEPPSRSDGPAILEYLQTKAPPVYDPFSGGGSIPLEAQRLGLRAYGADLNPVAVLIGKALLEIPPKFTGRRPINPISRSEAVNGEVRAWKGAQGMAEDVRYYGQWMRDEAEKRIGHYYPKAMLEGGGDATVIAWLWARTVRSPDPAARGAMVPLISNFMLASKPGKKAWVELHLDQAAQDGYRFRVSSGDLTEEREAELKKGTKAGRGSNFICALTGTAIDGTYIKSEGAAGRIGIKLMAIAAEGNRRRVYCDPSPDHEVSGQPEALIANPIDAPTSIHPQYMGCVPYGIDNFYKMFTSRQMLTLTTFADLIREVREKIIVDNGGQFDGTDSRRLSEGGSGITAYADAVATYLAFAVSRTADLNNNLCRWEPGPAKELVGHLFSRQNIPIVWDFAEASPFSGSSGDWSKCLSYVCIYLDHTSQTVTGTIEARSATQATTHVKNVLISTDPPYYDNIPYADLSDFFYVWLKRSLEGVWPDLFRRLAVPKAEELVADVKRYSGREKAEAFFMDGMSRALSNMATLSDSALPVTIYYAFKQSGIIEEGVTSAGWSSFLQAVIDSGFAVDGTWPIRTESTTGLKGTRNALASSIVLVCRSRPQAAAVVTRADFIRALKREMPAAIDAIRKAGIGPVDMQQSVIGPGMGIFSRHARILEDDDSSMSVKTALAVINRVWEEIENELDQAFDPETQVALAWYGTYGFDPRASGELITLTTAKNTSDRALFDSGVFKDMKGKAKLTPREELPSGWTPAGDKTLTTWECVQHTARVLNAPNGGGEAAAALVAQMGPKAEEARALAYRLFEIATNKGWATEALVYNELAQEWTKLEDRAATLDNAGRALGPSQAAFSFEGMA